MTPFLQCPGCKAAWAREALTSGNAYTCVSCGETFEVELFPAADRSWPAPQTGEPLLTGEEAACFHHADRKAVNVCAECGRFLCRLCDFELEDTHYCATCLERRRKAGHNPRWVTSRWIWDELALVLAVLAWVGLIFLSPLALWLAWRHRHAPISLTQRRAWRIPLALVLSSLHLLTLAGVAAWLLLR